MNKGNIAIARNQGDAKGSLMRKNSSGGSENRSDDSGSCSIGNNSFGFNFDAEDMATEEAMMANEQEESADAQAADIAVAGLTSIATTYTKEAQSECIVFQASCVFVIIFYTKNTNPSLSATAAAAANGSEPRQSSNLIMTLPNPGTVVSESSMTDCSDRPTKKAKKAVAINEDIREERNAREKERSFRISRQINEIRNLLSSGGVIVPKGTKSSVLTEAASYIRMLQQHQYRSEIDRHQLIQQMQTIGGGALGPEAASAIRHVAAQNGVWSLGNFGGVPPKSAMSYYQNNGSLQPNPTGSSGAPQQQQQQQPPAVDPAHLQVQTKIEDHECRLVFNSCSVGMVSFCHIEIIASLLRICKIVYTLISSSGNSFNGRCTY
jgi:hypothetical protein